MSAFNSEARAAVSEEDSFNIESAHELITNLEMLVCCLIFL